MQVAALMSGKTSVGLSDLHCVCAQWLQVAQAPPPGLQAFGSQDAGAAHSHIAKALRYQISGNVFALWNGHTCWYHEAELVSICKLFWCSDLFCM